MDRSRGGHQRANPTGAVSWACYLFDYGTGAEPASGEMTDPLIYSTAYRRSAIDLEIS